MKETYTCEICGAEFSDREKCIMHEIECRTEHIQGIGHQNGLNYALETMRKEGINLVIVDYKNAEVDRFEYSAEKKQIEIYCRER